LISYLVRRLLAAVPLLLVVSFLVFFLSRAGGRDPVDAILGEKGSPETREKVTRELGLDKPLIVQYGIYLKGIVTRGDFGVSYIMQEQPVAEQIGRRFPPTVELATAAMILAILVGIPAGLASAVWRNTWVDYLMMGGSLLGISVPVFWLGLLLIFALGTHLPFGGNIDPMMIVDPRTGFMLIDSALSSEPGAFKDAVLRLILPAMTLATIPLAMTARITRASLLEVMGSDYIRTARAKGLSGLKVVMRHAFRNALIPVVTLLGLEFGYLLGGAVLTETVFSWPGMGTYVVDAVFQTDPMAICGGSIVIATTFIAVNLAVDVLYAFVDPRIRYS
jgi:peptide/nickel transport system permease protein